MSMDNSQLNDKLSRLNDELNQAQPANEASQAVVADLKQRIQPLVDQPELDHSHHYQSLRERLDHAAVHLQVEHPTLALAIQHVLDELAGVGI